MEAEVENLKRDKKQKVLQFETLDNLLKKTQNENKEHQKRIDKAAQEVCTLQTSLSSYLLFHYIFYFFYPDK